MNKFMHGSSLLQANSTIPGVTIDPELKTLIPTIFKKCTEFGLDYYPSVVQMCSYDEISELAAYGGFPVRWPHYKWGMEYESLQRGYEFGHHRIYEMVINNDPSYIYCLNSNTLLDNVTVIAHALGHSHFFKNNIFFSHTDTNAINNMANNGVRIRKYMSRYGKEKVTEFIDHVLKIETLVDYSKAWSKKEISEITIVDKKNYKHPNKILVDHERNYMDPFINNQEYMKKQHEKIAREEEEEEAGIVEMNERDIFGYIKNNVSLKPWQQDIISILYSEAMYFAPQAQTKMCNEGFASWTDLNIIAKMGLCSLGQEHDASGIVEYSAHKMGVLGGKYSMNPYKIGYTLLSDIEDRWNKGMFGDEWENCTDIRQKENWDKKLGLGKEKVFEVCKYSDDVNLINEFFTQDFCDRNNFFEWEKNEGGEIILKSRDAKKIKKKLMRKYLNRGLPDIRLVDPNFRNRGQMLLQHVWDGRTLYEPYVREVLASLCWLIKAPVVLETKNANEEDMVFYCGESSPDYVTVMTKASYIQKWSQF